MTYHSLWISTMGAYKLSQPKKNKKKIQKLQNRTLRKILFKKQQDSIRQYYKELEILKFSNLLYLQNCLFMSQIETSQKVAKSFADLKHW